MKLDVYNLDNEKVGEVEVSDQIFGAEVKPHLFHEVVRMQLAGRRGGNHQQKTRSQVRGGGAKPYRQKGTGRARQGTTRAPHWVGGGRAFPCTPRDYSFRLNKKKKRAALRSALSMIASEGRLTVVDAFELEAAKTKVAVAALGTLIGPRLGENERAKAVVIDGTAVEGQQAMQNNENLRLSVRNLQSFKYLRPDGVNVRDLLHFGRVIVTQEGLKGLEARLG